MEKLLVDMDLKGFSTNTKKTYLLSINHFSAHFGEKPEALGEDEIRQYLHHEIVKRKQSSSSVIVSYSALRFFFETRWVENGTPGRFPESNAAINCRIFCPEPKSCNCLMPPII